jgi:UDP-glucose 4-epimerase
MTAVADERSFSGRKILITGGLGFLGSNLARRLVALGADVLIADTLVPESGCNPFNLSGIEHQVRIEPVDIRDAESMSRLIQDREMVFHLAAQVSHSEGMREPLEDLDVNCRGTLVLLEACRASRPNIRIVFTGTRQVYGRVPSIPVGESQPPHPVDINGIHKLAADQYLEIYRRIYGLSTFSLRLTNVYGPRMRVRDARNNFLGWWIRQVLEGKTLPVFGDGRRKRDFIYIEDAIQALLDAAGLADGSASVFNLGGKEPIRLADLASLLIELHGGGEFRLVPYPPGQEAINIDDYAGDYSRFRAAAGWEPSVSLRDGLARTLAFYEENGRHYW